jgi:hypothetical protein
MYEEVEMMDRMCEELMALKLQPPHVGHSFPFSQLIDAVSHLQSGLSVGKVVVEVSE